MTCSSSGSEPSLLRGLSPQQQVRLTEILDEYLQQLEQGQQPSRSEILSSVPDITEQLHDALLLYLDKLEELYQLADNGRPLGSDLEGKKLGAYVLGQEIGRGGMGIVCQAEDLALRRQVAVKLLPTAAMLEPKYIDRFRAEAQAAASLEHPNIVSVYSIGEEAGIHYFSMRLIDGDSLEKRIAKHRTKETHPATNSALVQFADVADALHQAHEFGIIHRDIKPSNLMLDSDGKLWVADFGLARVQGNHGLTGTGELVGTMRYMSPEQAMNRGDWIDHRTDIYSLGATLYEFLSGQPAVPGEDGPHLLRTITTQNPVKLRKLRPDLPSDLYTVIDKAMARHRDDRYHTAKELAADLRRVSRGDPIPTRLVTPFELSVRWMANHPRNVAIILSCLVAMGLLLTTGNYIVNQVIIAERNSAIEDVKLAHSLTTGELIDELALIPGAEKTRQKYVLLQLRYYEDFAQKHTASGHMEDELARVYKRMGTLSEQLGKMGQAISYFQQSERLFAELVGRKEIQSPNWPDRFENCNFLSLALSRAGRHDEAIDLLEKWVLMLREMNTHGTLVEPLKVQYGLAENNYGLIQQKTPVRQPDAAKAFQLAIQVLDQDNFSQEFQTEVARGLGAAKHNLGSLLAKDPKSRDQALVMLNAALDSQLKLAEESRNKLPASNDLLTTYISLGNFYLKDQNEEQASEAFNDASKLAGQLVKISPLVDSYRRDLAVSLANLGMALFRQDDILKAQQNLEQAVAQYEVLLHNHPQHTGLLSSLGITLNNYGILLQRLGKESEAEMAFIEAASYLEKSQPSQALALGNVYRNHARMLRDVGRLKEAQQLEEKRQLALAQVASTRAANKQFSGGQAESNSNTSL